MSLQVWLPLNGSLENQGLKGENPSLMGSGITYTAGKIGQAATFPNNCNSCIHMPGLRLQTGTFASWILIKGAGATSRQCIISEGRDSYNDGVEIYASQAGTTIYFKAHEKVLSTTIELNKWYHISGVFGDGQVKLYLNGNLINTITYTTDMTYQYASDLTLGKMSYSYTSTSSYFSFNGQLNDVRIYDHALSDKEVEEIAKGLVLHYKLDQPNQNLLRLIPKSQSSGSYCAYQFNMTENLIANQTYTLQLWDVDVYHSAKTAAQTGIWVYWGGGSVHLFNWAGPTYFTQDNDTNYHADYLVKTFTPTSSNASGSGATNAWFDIYNSVGYVAGTMTMHIGAWKLEKGSVPTPLSSPGDNIIYDSSGYIHNGILTGDLTMSNDTARYLFSSYFGVYQSPWIQTQNLNLATLTSCTVTWWQKNNTTGNSLPFVGQNGSYYIGAGSTTTKLYHCNIGSIAKLYKDGIVETSSSYNSSNHALTSASIVYTNNEWHFYCISGADLSTWTTFKINSYSTGWPVNSYLSDVRIYATALTAEQVAELYHTSASIDKEGNMYAREIIE